MSVLALSAVAPIRIHHHHILMAFPFFSSPSHACLSLSFLAAAVLITVYVLEFGFGYPPCEYCLWQRLPYGIVLFLGLLGNFYPRYYVLIFVVSIIAFLGGGALALYHLGLEYAWWTSSSGCTALPTGGDLDAIREAIMNAPVIRCDESRFTLLGVSLAGLNLATSLAFAAYSVLLLRFHRTR